MEPVWRDWLARWPTPADLAAEAPGEAVRAWGRLGYPRRALRLHEAARAIVDRHGGEVPGTEEELRALPGIGAYTAAAVACFAFRRPAVVVDTNVRRVLVRTLLGEAQAAPAMTRDERALAGAALPEDEDDTVVWNVAAMELGALVCAAGLLFFTTSAPWPTSARGTARPTGVHGSGSPRTSVDAHRPPGSRALLAVLGAGPVSSAELARAWPVEQQRLRCLDSLVADGLVEPLDERYRRFPPEQRVRR